MFEIGRQYVHTSGKAIRVIAGAYTNMHGYCLIAEDNRGDLIPVGNDSASWRCTHTDQSPEPRAQSVKLSDVIKIWDILNVKDTGKLGFCDLEKVIDETVGVENDIST